MTSQNNLDLKGDFRSHPFAELLVEIVQAKLNGSLRLSREREKAIVYFRDGLVVYAVSNSRDLRLFSILLSRHKLDEKTLARVTEFANDIELAASLEEKKIFSREQINDFVAMQIESIIVDALTWPSGDWLFSPLTRLREDLIYKTDVYRTLVEYARCLPPETVDQRFRGVPEAFFRELNPLTAAVLQPHESYVLDLFKRDQLTIEQLRPDCSLAESAMLQTLYVLWLGGLLVRRDWNAAFSATKIGEIRTAKVSLVKQAVPAARPEIKTNEPDAETAADTSTQLPEVNISVEDYLARVENAETLYDVLGITDDAGPAEIKHSYFAMARLFHPDRFHREDAASLRRIQLAFTEIAHAYETLKTDEGRKNYDFKMRKELEIRGKRKASGKMDALTPEDRQNETGLESFEKGLEAMADEEYPAAAGHLARAVHYSPQNALYHAFFGQALSYLERQNHRAESELQTAVRLDPANPKIRMMLVEFFVEMKMAKRAEGELKRFLETVPGNKEATKMLADIQRTAAVQP